MQHVTHSQATDYKFNNMDLLSKLNDKQREAVLHKDGPLLILAGPGSGKTKTLTHRIAHLIASGVEARNILAVTFTNKAADEMRERVAKLLSASIVHSPSFAEGFGRVRQMSRLKAGPPKPENVRAQMSNVLSAMPTMGTFHSICARILREHAALCGYSKRFCIYDDADQLSLIKKCMKDLGMNEKELSPQKVRAEISRAKDELKTPELYKSEAANYFERQTAQIYPAYQDQLLQNDAMDFDDLIMKTVLMLQYNKNVRDKLRKKFRYILVDEYQDTNTSQYTLVNILAQGSSNLCVVGDDAQAIYSWRNADFQNILDFERDWPEAKIIKLEQNYRSTRRIVEAASRLIANNMQGYPKELWTQNEQGEQIVAREVANEHEEAEFILGEIENLVKEAHYKLKDFVILYRTNAQSRALEEIFIRAGTPYKIVGGVKFYQRAEIKDLIGWLRLGINEHDAAARERATKLKLADLKEKLAVPAKNKEQAINAIIKNIKEELTQSQTLAQLLKIIIEITNAKSIYRDGTERGEDRWQNIQELLSVSQDYTKLPTREAAIKFLEDVALAQEADEIRYNTDLVHFMTLHMAKGLEFPVVFIAGCEEGILPHANSMFEAAKLEEERRLIYVGITRAQKRAYLTFARRRMLWGASSANPPSSFLFEIPQEYIKFVKLEDAENEYEKEIEW